MEQLDVYVGKWSGLKRNGSGEEQGKFTKFYAVLKSEAALQKEHATAERVDDLEILCDRIASRNPEIPVRFYALDVDNLMPKVNPISEDEYTSLIVIAQDRGLDVKIEPYCAVDSRQQYQRSA
jgi:hypothetical protein